MDKPRLENALGTCQRVCIYRNDGYGFTITIAELPDWKNR